MAMFNRKEMDRISQELFNRNYDNLSTEQQEEVDDIRNKDSMGGVFWWKLKL